MLDINTKIGTVFPVKDLKEQFGMTSLTPKASLDDGTSVLLECKGLSMRWKSEISFTYRYKVTRLKIRPVSIHINRMNRLDSNAMILRKKPGGFFEYMGIADIGVSHIEGGKNHYDLNITIVGEGIIRQEEPQTEDPAVKTIRQKYGYVDPKTREHLVKTFYRDPDVNRYAKSLAAGKCELCGKPAPFTDLEGNPYLETHHVKWLSRGGTDTIDNVVALCPNCHSRMHVLDDNEDVLKLTDILLNR